MVKIYMTIINFDDIIGKNLILLQIMFFVYHILKMLLFSEKQILEKQTF